MKKKGILLRNIVGQNVRIHRAALGLSQEALAERCGIKRTYIGSIERAEVDLRLETLSKLAQGLDVDPYRLLLDAGRQLRGTI